MKSSIKAFLCLCLISLIAACTGGESQVITGDITTPTPTPGPGTTVGFVDKTKFFVKAFVDSSEDVVYETHTRAATDFATACEIPEGTNDVDLACIIDAKESDIITQGISLMYNVPAGMCAYLHRETYWYYNYEPGVGPEDVKVTLIFDANDEFTNTAICEIDGSAPLPCNSTNFADLVFDFSQDEPKIHCVYDHSATGENRENGPNCCLGKYKFQIDEDHSAAQIDEVQSITFSATPNAGNMTLKFSGQTTAAIAHTANAAAVQARLEALSTIGLGNVSVAGSYAVGFTITFQGALAQTNVAQIEVDGNTLEDTGVPILVFAVTTTQGRTPTSFTPEAPQERSWGGDLKKCIGGAGRTSWTNLQKGEGFSREGYPTVAVKHTGKTGVNDTYKIEKAIPNRGGSALTIANYFTGPEVLTTLPNVHNHEGIINLGVESDQPFFVDPVDDRSGTRFNSIRTILPGRSAYDFRCLDASGEVRNRIRVYIREWDDKAQFDLYLSSRGVSGTHNSAPLGSELEGIDCSGVFGFCNDSFDADDLLNIFYGGNYSTVPLSDRHTLFPMDFYEN